MAVRPSCYFITFFVIHIVSLLYRWAARLREVKFSFSPVNQFEIENQEINFFSYAIQMLSDTRNYPIFPLYLITVLEISSSLP